MVKIAVPQCLLPMIILKKIVLKIILTIYLFEHQSYTHRETDLSSASSFSRKPQQPGLGQGKAGNWEFHPGLPCVLGAQELGLSPDAFPSALAISTGMGTSIHMGYGCHCSGFTCHTTLLDSHGVIFERVKTSALYQI